MTATDQIRCVLYLRISLDSTGEQLAVTRQRKECTRIAHDHGWDVIGEYVDNSIGAYNRRKKRPGYDRMVADYEAGKFEAIVCWDLDRLTRQPVQLEYWIERAEDHGLLLTTATGDVDLTNDNGIMFAGIKANVARAESGRKAARQRAALRQRAEQGKVPLGVRLTGYTTGGEIIEKEAATVRQVFAMARDGESLYSIAAWLTAQRVPARRGGQWNPSSVRGILTNPRYAGRSYYNRTKYKQAGPLAPGTWPPVVDALLFDAVQVQLNDPARRTATSTTRKHLGSGLYLCGVCDRPVRAHTAVPSGGTSQVRYRCPDGHITRTAAPIDALVLRVLRGRLAQPGLERLLAEVSGEEARALSVKIQQLQARRRQTQADYDTDLIDGARYKAKTGTIDTELDAAEAKRAAMVASSAVAGTLTAADPVAEFDGGTLASKRATLAWFLTVHLDPAPRGRHFQPRTVRIQWREH